MKKRGLNTIIIIVVFFIGIIGTLLTLKECGVFDKEAPSIKTGPTTNVNITESDTIKSAVDKVYGAVVYIESYKNLSSMPGSGSGFVYKEDSKYGYILTNHHVIEGTVKVEITNIAGDTVEATVLGSDAVSDTAVLRIDKKYVLQVATLGKSVDSELGDTIFTVGSPLGKTYMGSVTKGILSGKNRSVTVSGQYVMEVLQVDAALNSGNSGGPLVNINGEVIGINSMKLVQTGIEGMGFAIPIEYVQTMVEKLEKGEKIERPVLGVTTIDASNTYQLFRYGINLDSSIKDGIVVVEVSDDSPAKRASIKKGDIITKLDGEKTPTMAYFRSLLYKHSVGDTITITVNRDGKTKDIKVKLDSVLEND